MNKETKDNKNKTPATNNPGNMVDLAKMGVQSNILIKDKDTNQVILNKRG